MHDLKYLWTCLSLYFFVGSVQASCLIDLAHLSANYVYLSNNNGVYDIQRSDIVEIGRTVYLLCNVGLLPTAFQCQFNSVFSPALGSPACAPPDPVVINVQDTSCPFPSTTFAVGFNFNGRFMELYRNCFDVSSLAFQHSIYKAYRYVNNAQRINAQWKSDQISGQFDNAYERRTTQACLSTTLGAGQPQCKFDRGHMTPASAFISTALKKSTFRYLNAIPQYQGVNRGKWKAVETWVNNMVRGLYDNPTINNVQIPRTYNVLKVCIGALGVHRLKHNTNNNMMPIYLLNNNQIPVPEWMYKIVSHLSGDKWVMLSYNHVDSPSQQALNQICQAIPCHPGLNLNTRAGGHTVCCQPNTFITNNAPHLTGVC
uniref:GG11608 n=2 Tax=Drosophila erecta TaxID=7220 RepID=B3P5R2_DROER